jgi:hypothetical protein
MDEHDHEYAAVNVSASQTHEAEAMKNRQTYQDRRVQRLEELTAEALDEPDALRANVRVATAQLLDIGYQLGDEIKTRHDLGLTKPKAKRDGAGAINTLMLVHRQITRYVQLDQQWASERNSDSGGHMTSAEGNEES